MNATFQHLYDAELLRTGSESRAYSRAVVLHGFLQVLAWPDGGQADGARSDNARHRFPERPYKHHKAALRRAGLATIGTPAALAALGRDLGVSDTQSLARLVRHLNASARWKPTTRRAATERAALIAAAQELIEVSPPEPADEPSAAGAPGEAKSGGQEAA